MLFESVDGYAQRLHLCGRQHVLDYQVTNTVKFVLLIRIHYVPPEWIKLEVIIKGGSSSVFDGNADLLPIRTKMRK
jgi:hypothetical protein